MSAHEDEQVETFREELDRWNERGAEWDAEHHETTVTQHGKWGECSATCICGWISATNYRSQVEAEADEHLRENR